MFWSLFFQSLAMIFGIVAIGRGIAAWLGSGTVSTTDNSDEGESTWT